MDKLDDVVEQLRQIGDTLNDISMSILSAAIRDGETSRPPLEKKISQARRSVEKAVHLLERD